MPSPFPGMDPYLEAPNYWAGVHLNLIAAFQEILNRQLRPRYVADIEERIYLIDADDPAEDLYRIPDLQLRRPAKQNGSAVALAEPL